jgi:hypothetical protein
MVDDDPWKDSSDTLFGEAAAPEPSGRAYPPPLWSAPAPSRQQVRLVAACLEYAACYVDDGKKSDFANSALTIKRRPVAPPA